MRLRTVVRRWLCALLLVPAASLAAAGARAGATAAVTAVSTSLLSSGDGGDCQWQEDAFADEDAFLCPGAGGFRVYIRSLGVDQWPAFSRGRELSDLRAGILRVTGADVIDLTGDTMEWRMAGERPVAAIFQMRTERDDGSQSTSHIVARVTGDRICVVGQATSQEAARRMADGGGGCR